MKFKDFLGQMTENQKFDRYSNRPLEHMIKYSGALDDYPWLEQFYQYQQETEEAEEEYVSEIKKLEADLEYEEVRREDAEYLLELLFDVVENRDFDDVEYLKNALEKQRNNSPWYIKYQ